MKRTVAFLLSALALHLFVIIPAVAQSAADKQANTAKIQQKVRALGIGERVKITAKLYDGVKHKGYVREASEDSFVIVDKTGAPQVVRYADVKSVSGHNMSTGAKIAIGIGIGAGVVLAILGIIIASND